MKEESKLTRKKFVKGAALLGSAFALARPLRLLGEQSQDPHKYVHSRGYAARNETGKLSPWKFDRRAVGDFDVLIDIKYSGVCHSDIHQLKGDWGPQKYPQVPGHEIAGVVSAVGPKVTKFKVGDKAGVGCMVDSCGTCDSCKDGQEQHCEKGRTLFTYGYEDKSSPTGITQGGYSTNIVVKEDFVIKIPSSMKLQDAAPLLCAGITTYSPLVKESIKKGDEIAVAGIGGLGHLAIKLAISRGAKVHAFTTTKSKMEDIRGFGATPVFVESTKTLQSYAGKFDFLISTIPVNYDVGAYASTVKPNGTYTQVGMPKGGTLTVNNFAFAFNRVNFNASLIGGIPLTQEIVDYCAKKGIAPEIQVIPASKINQSWQKVLNKEARYRYVIDASTF
ncbi:MAG: Zn-dependent alcohol dehydrogenase [Leptospiraceae bacterium]|nr:Zn-dependent alcohol dehydrogenase [Leptospiraceae bacterium]